MSTSIDYKKLNEVFNKFAGKEVQVTEEMEFYESWVDTGIVARLSPSDKVVAQFKKAVEDMGLGFRVCMPSVRYADMDTQPNRMNIGIFKAADGKYRISPSYLMG